MTSPELERLADRGHLHREPPLRKEVEGLLRTGSDRLSDARLETLSTISRFDLAYSAARALALAALRLQGYRSNQRYIVFQAVSHTLGLPPAVWRLLAKAHLERNRIEYEGIADVSSTLLTDVIDTASRLLDEVEKLPLPEAP